MLEPNDFAVLTPIQRQHRAERHARSRRAQRMREDWTPEQLAAESGQGGRR